MQFIAVICIFFVYLLRNFFSNSRKGYNFANENLKIVIIMKLKIAFLLTFSIVSAVCFGQKVKTVTLNTDMRCARCEAHIVAGLKEQPGVQDVSSELLKKTVTVTYDKKKTSPKQLISAIESLNFKAEVAKKGKKSTLKVEECKGEGECEEEKEKKS